MDNTWRKSTFSAHTSCVEVRQDGTYIEARDSKNRDGLVLQFTKSEWSAFISGVKAGEFD
jgi:hypothetical protein